MNKINNKPSAEEITENLAYFTGSEEFYYHSISNIKSFIYTEVIKYSTLLKRAKQRNKIFIDKITETNIE